MPKSLQSAAGGAMPAAAHFPRRRPARVPTSPALGFSPGAGPSSPVLHLRGSGADQTITDLILSAEQAVATAEAKAMDRKRRGFPSYWREAHYVDRNLYCHYEGLVAESYKVPGADGIQLSAREKSLRAAGWRFIALPKLVRRCGDEKHRTPLEWDTLAGWLAIPPDHADEPARVFEKKRAAMDWAEDRA